MTLPEKLREVTKDKKNIKIGFFLQNHGILAGRRPVDLLRERRLEPVMKAVEAYV